MIALLRPPLLTLVVGLGMVAVSSAQPARPGGPPPPLSIMVDGAVTSRTDFTARGVSAGGVAVTQAGARLRYTLPAWDGRWQPTLGLDYQRYDLDLSAGTPLPDTLQRLRASFGVAGSLTPEWTFFGQISPSVANAGSGFSERGTGFGVIAIASRKFHSDVSAGFGLVYDSLARGTGRLLPVATVDWTPAPGWRAFVGFPRTGVSWQVNPTLKAEFVAEADFGSFYVNDDPSARIAGRPPLDRTRLEYQAVRVGPAVTWKANPGFQTRLAVGAVPVLNIDYHRRDYELKSDDTSAFASVELEWRF